MSKKKKGLPEIPNASMADIAFMLLIFFLVATTMSVDTGITRVLPPYVDPDSQQDLQVEVKERNMMTVRVNQAGSIMVAEQGVLIGQLKDLAKAFITNPLNDENKPEKVDTEIPLIGTYPVSQAIISLQTARGTLYTTYIAVQNELTRAINEIRDEVSMGRFGRLFNELDHDQRDAMTTAVRMSISEAEPVSIGGN